MKFGFCWCTFDPWNQPHWENETTITYIPSFFVKCLISYCRILDGSAHLYASMTSQVIEGVWYNISGIPTWTIHSVTVSMTRDITHTLCTYDCATSFNRRPVSGAAPLIASHWAPCLNIAVLLRVHTPVKNCCWSNHPTRLSVLDDDCAGTHLATKLTYALYWEDQPSLLAARRLECWHHFLSSIKIV